MRPVDAGFQSGGLTTELRDVLLAAMQPPASPEALALRLACAIRRHFAGQYLYFGTGRPSSSGAGKAGNPAVREEYRRAHSRLMRELARRHGCSIVNIYALVRRSNCAAPDIQDLVREIKKRKPRPPAAPPGQLAFRAPGF